MATDDRENRPFPFADKKKLAQIAGVNPKQFFLVKSPFAAKEITSQYDPNNTVLIFARSEKDRDEYPMPAKIDPTTGKLPLVTRGPRKGQPVSDYLQYYKKGADLAPFSEHAYMAYLPTVQFDAGPSGVTSATQIRDMWPQADDAQKNEIVTDLYPRNPKAARQILDKYLGGAVAEGKTKTATRGDPHPDKDFYFPVKDQWPEKLGPMGQKKERPDVELDERSVSKAQFRTMAAAAHNPKFAKKVGISGKVAKEFHKADKKSNYKSLPAKVDEDGTSMDPTVIQMKKRAKVAHPFASSDEEALALYVADRSKEEVRDLRGQQERELAMINRIEKAENTLEKEVSRIDHELAMLASFKTK